MLNVKIKFEKCFIFIIFTAILINNINIAEAGYAKIWDTMVKENSTWQYNLISSQSWNNKANWKQVPYGNTSWNFKGDVMLDNGDFLIFFHSNGIDAPFIYSNISGNYNSYGELYSYSLSTNPLWGNGNGYRIKTILINNTDNEIVVDNYADNRPYTSKLTVVRYKIKKDTKWVEISPQTSEEYWEGFHSSPQRFGVAPNNTENGTDWVIDPQLIEPAAAYSKNTNSYPDGISQDGNESWWYAPNSNNIFLLQEIVNDESMFTMTYPDAPSLTKPRINTNYEGYIKRLTSLRSNMKPNQINDKIYIGVINYKNVFHKEDINIAIPAGSWYNSTWHPTIPGRWRMSARVNYSGVSTYYTNDVYNGNFNFRSPVNGKLEVVLMYLYDRTIDTPNSVKTPMDIYRDSHQSNSSLSTTTPTLTSGMVFENRLKEGTPDTVLSKSSFIDIGQILGKSRYRDVIWYDLNAYNKTDKINNAILSLFWYYPSSTRNQSTTIEIYRPLSWDPSSVNWKNRSYGNPWTNPGGDWFDRNNVAHGILPYDSITFNASILPDNRYYNFNVTALVQEYVSGKYNNTGFFLKAKDEYDNYIAFYSYNNTNPNLRAKLVINSNTGGTPSIYDVNRDGVINQTDLHIVSDSIRTDIYCQPCDINNNKEVEVYDWVMVSGNIS